MAMAYLWVEGVNFDLTLFDTADIPVIRGASLALLRAPLDVEAALKTAGQSRGISIERILVGASQGCFRLEGLQGAVEETAQAGLAILAAGDDPELIRKDSRQAILTGAAPQLAPYAHLSFAYGLAQVGPGGEAKAMATAQACARLSQMRELDARPFAAATAAQACERDHLRPADTKVWFAADGEPGEEASQSRPGLTSRATAARIHFGRAQRQAFYRTALPPGQAEAWRLTGPEAVRAFVDDLHQMVAAPPEGTPLSTRSKIGVFYADGNAFGRLRGREPQAVRAFAKLVQDRHGGLVLPGLLEPFAQARQAPDSVDFAAHVWRDETRDARRIRLETLLWGGDELCFVMPSWLALDFAARFFEIVGDPDYQPPGGGALTYSAGLVIGNVKTPIRSLRDLCHELTDLAKYVGDRKPGDETLLWRNKLSLEILESLEPPAEGIKAQRLRILGPQAADPANLTLSGEGLRALIQRMTKLKNVLPRSQLYGWLRRTTGQLDRDAHLARLIADYEARMGHPAGFFGERLRLGATLDGGDRPLALDLMLCAELWDYVPTATEAR